MPLPALRHPFPRGRRRGLSRLAAAAALLAVALLAAACGDPTGPTARVPAPRGVSAAEAATPVGAPLVDGNSGKCLDVAGGTGEPGAPLIIYGCHGGANQRFTVPPVGATGEVRAYGGALCVDAAGGAGANGDRIIAWDCHGGSNQQWTRTEAGELRGMNGRCIDVAGASTEDRAAVILWECHGGANQRWDVGAPEAPAVFVGAGDIAGCTWDGDEATAALLDTIPGVVWAAGDLAYENGTAAEFADCYDPTWGRHRARTRPAPGNHEYNTAGAAPYYAYFGDAAGPAGRGYYSYDVGRWHVVSLNSNVDVSPTSAQLAWLRADLVANPRACTIAYWHHARFSSAGGSARYQPLWQALYDAGAEVVLVGHAHNYERFAPQTPAGEADPARGIRQFVVGTGGAGLGGFTTVQPNSEVRDRLHRGVLKLELGAASYRWTFIGIDGVAHDTGEAACH